MAELEAEVVYLFTELFFGLYVYLCPRSNIFLLIAHFLNMFQLFKFILSTLTLLNT